MPIRTDSGSDDPQINMTPIIDVVFNLLIFFLIGAQIAEEEKALDVAIPESSQAKSMVSAPKLITINIYKNGRIVYQGKDIPKEDLFKVIRKAKAANPEQKVELRGDKESIYGLMVEVLTICGEAGVESKDIHLAVHDGPPAPLNDGK